MKTTVAVLIVCLLLVSVTGVSVGAQKELSFLWHGGAEWHQTMEDMATLFSQRNPDIKVKVDLLPWGEFNEKWPMMIAGGTAPDMMGAHPAQITEMVGQNFFVDVTQWVEEDMDWEDIVHRWIAVYDDKIVGVPIVVDTMAFRYNEDLFRAAGLPTPNELFRLGKERAWNWDAYIESATKLTVDKNGDGRIDQYGTEAPWIFTSFAMIRAFGGEVFNEDYTECVLNRAGGKAAFRALADLAVKYKCMVPPEMVQEEMGFGFLTGRVGIGNCNIAEMVLTDARKNIPFKWDYCLNPAGPFGFNLWGDGDAILINPGSKYKRESFEFSKWQASNEVQKVMLEKGMYNAVWPVRKSTVADPEWRAEYIRELDGEIIEIALSDEYISPKPYVPRTRHVSRVLYVILDTEIKNMWLGIKTADEALEDATRQINELLQTD